MREGAIEMDSRERVREAIERGTPDRAPLDITAQDAVLARLHADLRTSTHRELLERLGVDIVDLRGVLDPVYRGPVPLSRPVGDGVRESFWGWRQRVVPTDSGPEECFVDFVLSGAASVEELERHAWPSPDWFDFSEIAERLRAWDGFAVLASGASVFQHATFLRGLDGLLVDMATAPEMAHWLMERFTDFYVAYFDRMLSAARGRIDILRVADDVGTQSGLLFSVEMFRAFLGPRIGRLADLAHAHGAKLLFHSCGAVRPMIDEIIAAGADILDPLQAAAKGMEPRALKEDYGDRICLHGGICTQHLLPGGAPGEVRDEVRRRIEVLGEGGGYIVAPCHVLQGDVPTANILAMAEACRSGEASGREGGATSRGGSTEQEGRR